MSCMVILGLGGRTYSEEHIKGTAEVITACSPDYVGALTLYLENGIKPGRGANLPFTWLINWFFLLIKINLLIFVISSKGILTKTLSVL